jgi:Carboxylesterase family
MNYVSFLRLVQAKAECTVPCSYRFDFQRLNLLGFLASSEVEKRAKSKGDAALNAGLLDQRLALQWVQKNIDAFGGDRDKVDLWPINFTGQDSLCKSHRWWSLERAPVRCLSAHTCFPTTENIAGCSGVPSSNLEVALGMELFSSHSSFNDVSSFIP